MKKIIYLSILCAIGSAHGQSLDYSANTESYPASYIASYTALTTQKNFANNNHAAATYDVALLNSQLSHISFVTQSISTATKMPTKTAHFFQTPATTNINLSSNSRFQYGLGISVEPNHGDYFSVDATKSSDVDTPKNLINTSAFANYQVNPNFSLTSAISVSNANNTGFQLSAGGLASKIFNRNHRLTAMFNLNWTNQYDNALGYWNQSERQSQKPFQRFGENINRTELRLGASWNWNIDTNWSLTTGATFKYNISNAPKNPFSTNPVTIFSVATYRF